MHDSIYDGSMYDIVVLGSINMDIVAKCYSFPKSGDNVFCKSIKMMAGGKGNNQAVSSAKYGKKVCFIGCIGQDSQGEQLRSNLIKQGISDKFLIVNRDYETGSCVALVEPTGDNTLLVNKGANFAFGAKEIQDIMQNIKAKILLIQMETSPESVISAMKIAKEKGIYVILDPAPADGINSEAFPYADLIVPNSNETQHITGIEVYDAESALVAARKIHQLGVPKVIVKMGAKGCLVYQNGQPTFIPSLIVKAVDTVGAGDCFAGALANALIDDPDLLKAVKFANIIAGIKVSRFGGHNAIPSKEEADEYIKNNALK